MKYIQTTILVSSTHCI